MPRMPKITDIFLQINFHYDFHNVPFKLNKGMSINGTLNPYQIPMKYLEFLNHACGLKPHAHLFYLKVNKQHAIEHQ